MSNEDKSIVIAGTMFLTLATALFITGTFIPKALGTALLIAVATYVFFDTCYYVKKDWYSRQWVTVKQLTKFIQVNHITMEVCYARQYYSRKRRIWNFA